MIGRDIKMKKVLSYKIICSFYTLVSIHAEEHVKHIHHTTKRSTGKTENVTASVEENVYEYDDLMLDRDPVYSQTTSLTNSRQSSISSPPPITPRPPHTLTTQSQPISSRTSTDDTNLSDSFSFNPSDSIINNSLLSSVLDDSIYSSIPGEENLNTSKKRNPKKDPLPALPDTLSTDNHLYERVSQVVPESPFKRKPVLKIKAEFLPRRPTVMPNSESQSEEFDTIRFIRD